MKEKKLEHGENTFQTNIGNGDSPEGSWFAAHPRLTALLALILGGSAAGASILSGVFEPPGGGGGDNEYKTIEGGVYDSGYRFGNLSTPLDDISELLIRPINGAPSDSGFVFFYGSDGLNATYIHDWITDPDRSDPIKIQIDETTISSEDVILDQFIHTKNNVYRGIKILDDGR